MGSQNILYAHQYGFREKSSTSTAVLEMLDFVYDGLDKRRGKVVSALMVDLKKAFDSVNHSILLQKLYVVGVRGNSHDLVASYLSNRMQYVSIRNARSSSRLVSTHTRYRSGQEIRIGLT